jgi:hypothetical protein
MEVKLLNESIYTVKDMIDDGCEIDPYQLEFVHKILGNNDEEIVAVDQDEDSELYDAIVDNIATEGKSITHMGAPALGSATLTNKVTVAFTNDYGFATAWVKKSDYSKVQKLK